LVFFFVSRAFAMLSQYTRIDVADGRGAVAP
jgi:hypothetical protein